MLETINFYLPEFTFNNSLVFGAYVLIYYLIITDDRFTFTRKIIYFFLTSLLFIISYYINKAPYDIIKDLFWYSLVLNISFIFHTLILDRAFHYCWKNHYEYAGFIISRLSFTLSLSGLIYFLHKFYMTFIANKRLFYLIENKQIEWYWKVYFLILNFIGIIIKCLKIILLFFCITFKNYELFVLGQNNINRNNILKIINYFIILLTISWLIGYPRLYIIWLLYAVVEIYNILNRKYLPDKKEFDKLNFLNKLNFTYENWKKTSYLNSSFQAKMENDKFNRIIYEKPYHKFFMFDLHKFLDNPHLYNIARMHNELKDDIIIKNPYPFIKLYKFYSWEEIIIAYSGIDIKLTGLNPNLRKDEIDVSDDELKILIKNALLINKGYEFIKKVEPFITEKYYNESVLKF